MNDNQQQLPELDAPTQHLMAMSKEIGSINAEKASFMWSNNRLEQENKELKDKVLGLESQLRSMTNQRDELREEQVKWLKKK